MFTDRERLFDIIEAICGARMHPNWFRIGGVAQDLPDGWDRLVTDFIAICRRGSTNTTRSVMRNRIFKRGRRASAAVTLDEAIEWGVTGPVCARAASSGTSARSGPTPATTNSSSTFPPDSMATATTAPSFTSRRCARACASSSSAWSTCRPARTSRRSSAGHAAAQGADDARHRDADHAFSGRQLGTGDSARRSTRGHRSDQRQQRLLPDERRQHDALIACAFARPRFRTCRWSRSLSRGRMIPDLLAILGSLDFVLADVDR